VFWPPKSRRMHQGGGFWFAASTYVPWAVFRDPVTETTFSRGLGEEIHPDAFLPPKDVFYHPQKRKKFFTCL